jgi:hypothetical protein
MQVVSINDIKPNPSNPRLIKDDKFKKLVQSLKDFPEMANVRPIVVNQDMVILGGNMRFKAMKEAKWKQIPVEVVDWDEAKQREFIIKDNVGFGEWDWDDLANNWNAEELDKWGLDVPQFEAEQLEAEEDDAEINAIQKLKDKFIVPPFSVLNARDGNWQERKSYWKELIKDTGITRDTGNQTNTRYRTLEGFSAAREDENVGSVLDPVLSEIVNLWFGLPNCNTFDCFAGDTVFGYVSSYLGNTFTGIELRQSQADFNNDRTVGMSAKYICDDGRNIDKHIPPNSQDLLFSCPPYFDLEIYSDLPNDASNQKEYKDFIKILDVSFSKAIKCIKENRFAVIVCGDVRDKKGNYYRFPDHIKDIFNKNGMSTYNELILVDPVGNLQMRVSKYMEHRKVGKTHQNVLVFYKGNPKEIKNIFPKIELNEGADA